MIRSADKKKYFAAVSVFCKKSIFPKMNVDLDSMKVARIVYFSSTRSL